jgi:hypothetical protein
MDVHCVVMACIEKTAPQRLQLKDKSESAPTRNIDTFHVVDQRKLE